MLDALAALAFAIFIATFIVVLVSAMEDPPL